MSELVLFGLICDLFGALVILVPETPLRHSLTYLGRIGRLERGRIVVFERNDELEDGDKGFEELNGFLHANVDEEYSPSDVYKISVNQNSQNLRLHRSVANDGRPKQDYVKYGYPNIVEMGLRRKLDSRVYATGTGLLVFGFALQIAGQIA